MIKLICDKCNKEFTQKSSYTRHLNRKTSCSIQNEIKFVDLFCGLGAFHYAFNCLNTENRKYKCVFACDIDEKIQKIYENNYGIKPEGDISHIDINSIPDFDILCAGFPCQPFSIAGKKEGFKDKIKGNLFYFILQIIDIKNPTKIVLENVKNIISIDNGNIFNIIIMELQKRGYYTSTKVIDSKYYNSPQSRKRLFIICDKIKKYNFPQEPSNIITPVSSIIDYNNNNFINYEDKYILEKCKNNKIINNCHMLYKLVHKKTKNGGRQGERVYSIETCGPTICASSGGPGSKTGLYYINNKIRRLNVKETLKMFGLNDDYKWNMIINNEEMLFYLGNSIVVNVLIPLLDNL